MRWLTLTAVSSFLLITLFTQVSSNAMFELELNHFRNRGFDSLGKCCMGDQDSTGTCTDECKIKFRVCLNVYQQIIDYKAPCTFGEIITPILGNNEIDFKSLSGLNPVQFSLDSWQNTFSLIIEAWHDNNRSSSYAGPVLVQRLMTQRWLDVNEKWTQEKEDGQHSSLSYQFRVVCQEHYYGEGCRKWCKPRDDSFGHYVCDNSGNVVCRQGWQDQDKYCLTPICSTDCHSKQGSCEKPYECNCHLGWEGEKCDKCVVYPGCAHGTCDKPWQCNCNEGWGGLFCNQDLNYCTNHHPCKNGATCHNTKPGSYSCQCPAGYRGTNCEITNHTCATDPCQNGGTCLDTGNDGFVCQCPNGLTGQYCHISGKTCSDRPCLNNALCRDTMDGFQCHCKPGFEGETCQISVNECDSNPCHNGGSCVDEQAGFRCVCNVGFSGSQCQTNVDDCSRKPCFNGAQCIDGEDSFMCKCPTGFAGHLCQEIVDYCSTNPCANGGSCTTTQYDFRCQCRPGWGGKYCSDPIFINSPCESSPCKNGGACTPAPELSNGYRCTCPPRLIGPQCTVPTLGHGTSGEAHAVVMSSGQIVLVVMISVAVPILAASFILAIICMKRRRRLDRARTDDEARRQNEQNIIHNSVNNKCLESHMIINSLDYPVKPINTESQYNQIANVHYPSKPYSYQEGKLQQQLHQQITSPYDCQKAVENTYSIVPARSTKTLNTDAYRLSLASRLEKELDGSCSRRSPCMDDGSTYCKTPDPCIGYSNHNNSSSSGMCSSLHPPPEMVHNSTHTLSSTCSPPSTCTTPSSIYVIEEHYDADDTYIATQV